MLCLPEGGDEDQRCISEDHARTVSERHARARVREAKPAAQQWQPKDHPNADAKGNIGLSYFNVGDVTEGTAKGQHWATLIRKAPTVIFGISEATPDLKRMLEEPPCYKDPDPSNTNPQKKNAVVTSSEQRLGKNACKTHLKSTKTQKP